MHLYSYIYPTHSFILSTTAFILFFILLLHSSCFSSYSYIYPVSHSTPAFILFLILLLHLSCSSSYSYIHPVLILLLHFLFFILLLHLSCFSSYFYIYHNSHAYPIPAIILLLHLNFAFILILILFHVDSTVWSLSLQAVTFNHNMTYLTAKISYFFTFFLHE